MKNQIIEATVSGLTVPEKMPHYLKTRLGLSGTMVKRVKYGGVFLNGENVHMRATVQNGDRIRVILPDEQSEHVTPKPIPLDILYEDGDILVVNKPDGMPMHPARNNFLPTLAEAVAYHLLPDSSAFHAIGRLDRDTRGIVLIAKTAYIAELLTRAMRRGETEKEYTARVTGMPSPAEGTIDAPIAREKEAGMRRVVRYEGEAEGLFGELAGKRAVTHYRTVGEDGAGNAILKVKIETGRTHQIRVHMAYIGHPLVGDFLYGERIEGKTFDLVCSSLTFPHPRTGERMQITLPGADNLFFPKKENLMTIRSMIEPFVYPLLERYVAAVADGGENTELFGVRVLEEKDKFVHGALAEKAILLYIKQKKEGDPRAAQTLANVHTFLGYAAGDVCKTWGKFALLRGFCALADAGLLGDIDEELVGRVKEKTDYRDFFDTETLSIINLPSNYLQVAMACAGLRERLGWESGSMSDTILQKLIGVMEVSGPSGWMDEQPPYGRFDRYSMIVTSEISDTLQRLGKELPDYCKNNLKIAAEICLAMANRRGDGINYGRSLSVHGDGAAAEILSSALSRGLLDERDIPKALAYIAAVTDKIEHFWYDEERGSFNLFWDGRSTNRYRQVQRVLEVNLDMANHMIVMLRNLEIAGLADREVDLSCLPAPKEWTVTPIPFSVTSDRVRETFLLRRGDLMLMLPLIDAGSLYRCAAYLPYPALCGRLEGAPEAPMPYLIPEYRFGDKTYMPVSFFRSAECEQEGDLVRIVAKGHLAAVGEKLPVESDIPFTTTFVFDGERLSARFETGKKPDGARVILGSHEKIPYITPVGFEREIPVETEGVYDFMTPSGAILCATEAQASSPALLGWDATLA